jgi:CRP-like cAMP-binding protein
MSFLFQPRRRARELQLAHALRSVPLFRDVPAAELVAIWRRLSEVRVPAGTVLFQRGEPGDRFYVIQTGTLEVWLGLGPTGIPIRRLGPGDFVGELALLTDAPRSADVVVMEDAALWALDRTDFEDVLSQSVPLLRALNRALCTLVAQLTFEVEEAGARRGVAGLRFGPYRVIEQIGMGGMAAVYSAVDVTTETAVAIKVLPVAWGSAPELRERLGREAAALQQINHPNVIKVLDVGEVETHLGGGAYLAMEWVPNALDRVLRAQYPEPLPVATALRLAHGVAQGLAAVDAAGLVHRDVKPSNILLRADGSPVLADFGLVAVLTDAAQDYRLTPSNVIVGTADYLSPEQIVGLPVDGRSDIYSLGVVLYEMVAGYVPFAGRDPFEILHAHIEEVPPPLPSTVPPAATAIVERALQKRPGDRFASAAAMVSALEAALA